MNGTLHANPIAAAAGLATIKQLEEKNFYSNLHSLSDDLLKMLQSVLDQQGVPAIATGQGSFWQILFMDSEPTNAMDVVRSNQNAMRNLDTELLRRGIYVLPGMRRFVSAVNTKEDFEKTVLALNEACRLISI